MIVLDSQTIDLSDLFGENNGLHDVDDKEEGIARSMTKAHYKLKRLLKNPPNGSLEIVQVQPIQQTLGKELNPTNGSLWICSSPTSPGQCRLCGQRSPLGLFALVGWT